MKRTSNNCFNWTAQIGLPVKQMLSGLRTKEIEMRKTLSDEMVKRLQKEVNDNDAERDHVNSDNILCELLEKLGYKDVVEKYNEVSKW